MYTASVRRQKTNTFFQMKTMNKTDQIQKLGSSIFVSMQRLQQLKIAIMSQKNKIQQKEIQQLIKVHNEFKEKQKSLMEIDQNSQKLQRLKDKVQQFLNTFTLDDLQKKIQVIKDQHQRLSHSRKSSKVQQQDMLYQISGESMTKTLLNQEEKQLIEIERCIGLVKQMAIDFSQLTLSYGQKINIASTNMKQAVKNMKQAHKAVIDTNTYEGDIAKIKWFLCALIVVILIVIFLIFRASRSN